eukprot:6850305-Prymnesium_polylepis.1
MVVTRVQEQGGVVYVDPRARRAEAAVAEEEEDDEYEVEAVLDARNKGRGMAYLIKWQGYDASENTWEPAKN